MDKSSAEHETWDVRIESLDEAVDEDAEVIYTHGLSRGPSGVRHPARRLLSRWSSRTLLVSQSLGQTYRYPWAKWATDVAASIDTTPISLTHVSCRMSGAGATSRL